MNDLRGWHKAGIAIGILLALGPVWAMLATLIGMWLSFEAIFSSNGQVRPEQIAGYVRFAWTTTIAGLLVCPVGIYWIIVFARATRRQKAPDTEEGAWLT